MSANRPVRVLAFWGVGLGLVFLLVMFFVGLNRQQNEVENKLLAVAEVIEAYRMDNNGDVPEDAASIYRLVKESGMDHQIVDGTSEIWRKILNENYSDLDNLLVYTPMPTSLLPYSLVSKGPVGKAYLPDYAFTEAGFILHAEWMERRVKQYVSDMQRLPANIAGLEKMCPVPDNDFTRAVSDKSHYQDAKSACIMPGAIVADFDYDAQCVSVCYYGKNKHCLRQFTVYLDKDRASIE